MNRVLLDAGPIVALLSPRDAWHEWANDTFGAIAGPFVTCEPVLAEVTFLLGRSPEGPLRAIDLVTRGYLRLDFRLETEVLAVRTLMTRYRSVPMSLADACLVRMTELEPRSSVMTLDTDFRIYRRGGRGVIPLITPL